MRRNKLARKILGVHVVITVIICKHASCDKTCRSGLKLASPHLTYCSGLFMGYLEVKANSKKKKRFFFFCIQCFITAHREHLEGLVSFVGILTLACTKMFLMEPNIRGCFSGALLIWSSNLLQFLFVISNCMFTLLGHMQKWYYNVNLCGCLTLWGICCEELWRDISLSCDIL